MEHLVPPILPIFLFVACMIALALGLLVFSRIVRPGRPNRVTRMPYESGMDPIHDTRRRFDVRFYLVAIAFLVFDVELLFLYPWAVVAGQTQNARVENGDGSTQGHPKSAASSSPTRPLSSPPTLADPQTNSTVASVSGNRHIIFAGVMTFVALLVLGFIYDWRKGVFQWR